MDDSILSRRNFLAGAVPATLVSGMLLNTPEEAAGDEPAKGDDMDRFYKIFPVGKVVKTDSTTRIHIFDPYAKALLGLEGWSHVNVLYWFDKNDLPQKRAILQVNPRGDKKNPLTGVFACRAPVRPNLIALSVCKILSLEGNRVTVDKLDAFDATPILDLKPYIPPDAPTQDIRVPDWAKKGKDG